MDIRQARIEDNEQLLSLTSQNGMEGTISIRIDRQPDFFSLLRKRGSGITYVAEHNHKLIGCFSCSESQVFINHEPSRIHYLSDLKVEGTRQGSLVAFRLCQKMKRYLEANQADLLHCTVAEGNKKMNPLLEGRMGLPKFHCLDTFHVLQFLPLKRAPRQSHALVMRTTPTERMIQVFNSFYATYQLGKVISDRFFQDEVLVAMQNGKMVAAISLLDPSPLKQTVLIRVNPLLRTVLSLSKLLPIPALPGEGEEVKTFYINNFYHEPGQEYTLAVLLEYARHFAYLNHFHFVSLGIHSKDPLLPVFDGFRKFTFRSNAYITSLTDNTLLAHSVLSGIPYEDYSLV